MRIPISITFDDKNDEEPEASRAARSEIHPRPMYIQGWMLTEYGYTDGCQGCDAKKAGLSIARNYSAACRKRVEEQVNGDARGQVAGERADERWKHWADKRGDKDEDDKAEEATKQ